ncbi:hypothetical protein [Nocardioides sp. NPDC006303]|uniref:hypothetical protein n=1 Tax=Nocardioides sp. NPDC006303 TaxID=3156747 RepID=UPI0033B58840
MSKKTIPTKTPVSPWAISVYLHSEYGDRHSGLEIAPTITRDLSPNMARHYDPRALVSGLQWAAGLIARACIALAGELADSSPRHKCGKIDECGIDYRLPLPYDEGGDGITDPGAIFDSLFRDGDFLGVGFGAVIMVPPQTAVQWKTRLESLIAELVANDAARPTEEDLREWREHVGSDSDLVGEFEMTEPAAEPAAEPR